MHAKYSKAKFAPWHNGSFQLMNVKMHWWRHFQEAYHCSRELCIISIILLSISHFHEVISWIYWSCKLYINFINNACFEDKCHKVNAIRKWRQIMVETKNSSGTLSTNDELVQEGFPSNFCANLSLILQGLYIDQRANSKTNSTKLR